MERSARYRQIWGLAKSAGLAEDQVRALALEIGGQESLREMSDANLGNLVHRLARLAPARVGYKAKPSGRRTAANETLLITGPQRAEIARLRGVLGGLWATEQYFAGACSKRLNGKVQPVTAGDAARVIEMLKQRIKHDAQRAKGRAQG